MWKNIASNCFVKQLFWKFIAPYLEKSEVCSTASGLSGVYGNKPHKDVFISNTGLEGERVQDACLMEWSQSCISMLTALALSYPGKESAVTTVPLRQSAPH